MKKPVNSYKKLVSVEPEIYEDVDAPLAVAQYATYLAQQWQQGKDVRESLTFTDWLEVVL